VMIVRSYDVLREYFAAFSRGEISLLVVKSRGGLGKTHAARVAMSGKPVQFFNGHATPLSIYLRLLNNKDDVVVFDDVDSLMLNKTNIALLKQLCEIGDAKPVRYETTAQIDGKRVPPVFYSSNRVCLLCNDFRKVGRNIKALLTRGIFIEFVPDDEAIIEIMKGFADADQEIISYLGEKRSEIQDLNFRLFYKCDELKNAGIDWKAYLRSEYKISQEEELALEIADLPVEERNERWVRETGKSIRSLQLLLRKTKGNNGV